MIVDLIASSFLVLFIVFGVMAIIYLEQREKQGLSNKIPRRFIAIPCIAIILFAISGLIIVNDSLDTPHISFLDIEEVYVLNDDEYVVKDETGKIYTIEPKEVCKGDTNQIICYTQPKLTPKASWWLGTDIHEYTLVLTNPDNVKEMPNLEE